VVQIRSVFVPCGQAMNGKRISEIVHPRRLSNSVTTTNSGDATKSLKNLMQRSVAYCLSVQTREEISAYDWSA
jgi:hypothetical protein